MKNNLLTSHEGKQGKVVIAICLMLTESINNRSPKKCRICGNTFPITHFPVKGRGRCLDCFRSWTRDYTQKWRENNKEKVRENSARHTNKYRFREWSKDVIKVHQKRGFDVSISKDELEILAQKTSYCPICGVELGWDKTKVPRGHLPISPTLDRVNNEKTITSKNVMIICRQCNSSKGARSLTDFIEFCALVVARSKDRELPYQTEVWCNNEIGIGTT